MRYTMKPKQTFPDALKDWRAQYRFTQAAAARALGRTLRTFQNWEQGRLPRADTQAVILARLQTFGGVR